MIGLRGLGLKILAGLTAVLGFVALLFRSQRDLARAERDKQNRLNAQQRAETLERANDALGKAQIKEREDVNNARQKAARGDFSDFSDSDY